MSHRIENRRHGVTNTTDLHRSLFCYQDGRGLDAQAQYFGLCYGNVLIGALTKQLLVRGLKI
jgi:hypothetical protein